jgi:hypothetical protein
LKGTVGVAHEAIADKTSLAAAAAVVGADGVDAGNGIHAALVEVEGTLVDVGAVEAVASEASITGAGVGARNVGACCIGATLIDILRDGCGALVHICAAIGALAAANVTCNTGARVASNGIGTLGKESSAVAVVYGALVDVCTAVGSRAVAVLGEARLAGAVERAEGVGA